MADVNELIDNQSFYIPSEENKDNKQDVYIPLVPGEYYAHIVDATYQEDIDVKGGKYKANVYNFFVELSPENKSNTYTYSRNGEECETTGEVYAGKRVKAYGMWRWIEPKEGDTFESNGGQNKYFMLFCEALGVECPLVKAKVGGKEVEVKSLPELNTEDINGKPVIAIIGKGKPWTNKEGKEVKSNIVRYVKQWEGGEVMEIKEENLDDLPF